PRHDTYLGAAHNITMTELVDVIRELMPGARFEYPNPDRRPTYPGSFDNVRAAAEFEWEPRGVRETVLAHIDDVRRDAGLPALANDGRASSKGNIMATSTVATGGLEDIDLSDPHFYAGDPHPTFARLRAEAPVFWSERGGFWALSKFEDVRHVGRSTDLFSSARGTLISDAGDRDGNGPHMEGAHHLIRSDPPAHTELRRLVSNSFRP